jgi:hypothetical protein
MISHCEFKQIIFCLLFQFKIKYIENNVKYFLDNIHAFIGTCNQTYNQTLQLKSPQTQPIAHHPTNVTQHPRVHIHWKTLYDSLVDEP